ncbi:MAG: hypothetical protein JW900_07395 [Anaerolineae bacterium]|nr:hypothetical protein [Anaerolineae bacterium]
MKALRPLIEGEQFTREEALRRQAIALSAAQRIVALLAQVGARVRPG